MVYIPAPDFSTAPPPEGPSKPGHILRSLKPSDLLAPLSPKGANAVVPVDAEALMPMDIKVGWRTWWNELLSGDFSIWALYNGCQEQVFRRGADLDRHIKHAQSKVPDGKEASSREHAYLNGEHQQESAKRSADLDRHIKHVHWKPPGIHFCDYKRCPPHEKVVAASNTSTPQQPFGTAASLSPSSSASKEPQGAFSRQHYLSAHYRDYHREDLCRRNVAVYEVPAKGIILALRVRMLYLRADARAGAHQRPQEENGHQGLVDFVFEGLPEGVTRGNFIDD